MRFVVNLRKSVTNIADSCRIPALCAVIAIRPPIIVSAAAPTAADARLM